MRFLRVLINLRDLPLVEDKFPEGYVFSSRALNERVDSTQILRLAREESLIHCNS